MQEKRKEAFCGVVNKTVQIKIRNYGLSEYTGHMRDMESKCRYNYECGIDIKRCKVINKIYEDDSKHLDVEFESEQLLAEDDPEKWDF